jgi:Domain of unknown function (DUF4214)
MSGTLFTWVGTADVNAPNNWITPLDWTVAGVAATRAPTLAGDSVVIGRDTSGSQDAIISGAQAIAIASLTVSGVTAGLVQGGHLIVGGSTGVNGIGGGGGGSLTVGTALVTSTNSGGAIVGGIGGVITATTMTVGGGVDGLTTNPDVLIGGGGTFDVTNMINNGGILADGGFFGLGTLVLNDTAITGNGFLEVSGNSSIEVNAATTQEMRVLVSAGQTASVILDQPTAFNGALNLLNPNSSVDLFFKGKTPTSITFDPTAPQGLVITFSDATTKRIPFLSNGVVALNVTTSTLAGFGEVVLGSATTPPPPPSGTVVLHGASAQYVIANDGGSLYVQDTVSGRDGTQILSGTTLMAFTDGTGVFDPNGSAEDVARLYHAALNRGPDVGGLEAWTGAIDNSHVPLSAVANDFAASPEFMGSFGLLSDPAYVQQLYQNVLGRAADPGGLQFWTGFLSSGGSRGDVLLGFSQSSEDKARTLTTAGDKDDAEAYRLYRAALGRTPDPAGQAFWSGQLASGATPTQVAQDFVDSPEFQSAHANLTPADFVANLYLNVLGRAGDPGGVQFWTNVVQTAGQATVVAGFADSPENRIDTAGPTHANWVFIPA